jgi:hypothetical protein
LVQDKGKTIHCEVAPTKVQMCLAFGFDSFEVKAIENIFRAFDFFLSLA